MKKRMIELLAGEGIELLAPIPLSCCTVTKKYLLEREGIESGTAFMMAVPYFTPACLGADISAYAVSRDYHLYFSGLFARILPILQAEFPQNKFCGFADHSPIDEREAAARADLGIFGDNGLLITEKYSSFIFLGEIITDAELECETVEIGHCEACGACLAACPKNDGLECLSAVTQKKGELSASEIAYIRKYGSAWGCDICQNVCPHTKRAMESASIFSPIPFFNDAALKDLTKEGILSMSDEDFRARAYSWRGRECILRNLALIGEKEDQIKEH